MKKILINNIFLLIFIFSIGYIANDVVEELGISFAKEAYADDPRSKRYIKKIIERCDVEGGYVSEGYVYGLEIDC
tara:strand:+ start:188 stop:412 length:225 start_codon:yes stop_codon:yes gene_type:complete